MTLTRLSTLCIVARVLCVLVVFVYSAITLRGFVHQDNPELSPVVFTDSGAAGKILLPEPGEHGEALFLESPAVDVPTWFLLFSLLPLIILAITMLRLERMFKRFQASEFFSTSNTAALKWVSLSMMTLVLLEPLHGVLETLVIPMPPELKGLAGTAPRALLVEVNIPMLILGAVLFLVAFILDEAVKMKAESDLTV